MSKNMEEIWKDVPGFRGYYQVSDRGHVRSLTRVEPSKNFSTRKRQGQIMKPKLTHDGYHEHTLTKENKRIYIRTHRLVLMAFDLVDNFGELEVNHLDGNKLNNKFNNLEWVTAKQNIHHSIEKGLQNPVGESNFNSKTTENQVIHARILKNEGKTHKEISDIVNIPLSRVKQIVNSYSWKHLPTREELANEQFANV